MAQIKLLQILNLIRLNGGVSYNLVTHEQNPTSGFMVSLQDHEERVNYVDTDVLGRFIHSHKAALLNGNKFFGVWRDGDGYVLDVSENIPNKRDAVFAAITRKQKAVWDCEKNDEIVVGNWLYRFKNELKAEYDALVAINNHTEAAILLAKHFGTAGEQMQLGSMVLRSSPFITDADYERRNRLLNKYHKQLISLL